MSTAAAPAAQRLELHASDGRAIVAHRFDAESPRAVVVVGAAIAMPLAGYFPGRRLKIIGDVPSGVMRQWRRFADSLWPIVTDWFDGLTPTQETSR